ncbi:MAG: nucleoside transporter C-terminal domain-containing protein [Prolixibacteraceae bacterium]|jgi:CNT family concentrative nucleoside transporter|nr:nucleoside transporter C-terminal domain-containing protein [Prolixibacteraceae bacterium]
MRKLFAALFIMALSFASLPGFSQENHLQEQIRQQTDSTQTISKPVTKATSNILLSKKREKPLTATTVFRGFLGVFVLLGIGYLISADRKRIPWKTVFTGLLIQIILAIGILYVPAVQWVFEFFGKLFVVVLDCTKSGTEFLLGGLLDTTKYGYIFLFQVLPTIIFFSALTSLLFYYGIIQKIVWGLAWVFTRLMKLSGAEALSVAGNIFLGQTEAPLMIKAYLPKMKNSEIMLVMSGGMATMAGGVLAAYIALLGGDDPMLRLEFAKHLLTASVMAAPAAIVFSKMIVPPDKEIDREIVVTRENIGSNVLDAISNGTSEGLRLLANVAAMLLAFIAFIALFNVIFGKIGDWTGLNELIASGTNGRYTVLSLQFLLGYIFSPVMWLIGVCSEDIVFVGRLLGEKLILTEFIGYISLADLKASGVFAETKSVIMATYVLCGFANFASIGIQIGGIGALAPNQRVLLSKYGVRSLVAGTLASLLSATIIGVILG